MSKQTVNLSANDVVEHLQLDTAPGWTLEAGELDVVCLNSRDFSLGYIVTLCIDTSKGYSFSVEEFIERNADGESSDSHCEFPSYDACLHYIRSKVAIYEDVV